MDKKEYYQKNREKRLAYQNAYYHRTKGERLRKIELLEFLEPEEFAKSKEKLSRYNREYYRKNRKQIMAKRKNLVKSRKTK